MKNSSKSSPIVFGDSLDFASRESYNLLRSSIEFSCPIKNGARAIGITSSTPHEGKSYTAINLACSIAKTGEKVLLVGGDMRRPVIAKTLGMPLTPGLSNLIVGDDNVDATYVHKMPGYENMAVLTAGDIPPNPAELIGSERMKAIIEAAKQSYDYILIDLPPVLAVADAFTVSKFLDGMIIVVRHNISNRKDVVDAVRQLKFANAKILGFVYNGYHSGKGKYYKGHSGYYKKYGYRNGYSGDYAKAYSENDPTENPV